MHPTQRQLEELTRLFRYVPALGGIVSNTTGQLVTKNNGKYIQLRFAGRTAVAQKAVWYFVRGEWPTFELDHRDGNKRNNKFRNLRACNRSQNMQNLKTARVTNRLGVLGVHAHKNGYRAVIGVGGVNKCLGVHSTPEEAHKAYLKAKRKLHPFGTL